MSDFDEREPRFMSSLQTAGESDSENTLRPRTMDEYVGQDKIKENLEIYIKAAVARGEPLDHVLLYGPPGLGKTTLAHIIASEMNAQIRITSGPAIEKAADLAAILTNLGENDVLFIDEIHRLNRNVEEVLYPAMEDFALDFVVGKGPSAKSIRLALPKFTLIGATTKAGMLTSPLRDRFGVNCRLEMYTPEQLAKIVRRSAAILGVEITDDGAVEIARRSRGTPRIANRILKRVRDFAEVKGEGVIDYEVADHGDRQTGARLGRRQDHLDDDRQVRRRTGRSGHARRVDRRGQRYDRGRLRTLSHADHLHRAHPARQGRASRRIQTLRQRGASGGDTPNEHARRL